MRLDRNPKAVPELRTAFPSGLLGDDALAGIAFSVDCDVPSVAFFELREIAIAFNLVEHHALVVSVASSWKSSLVSGIGCTLPIAFLVSFDLQHF